MDPESKQLLQNTLALAEENNKMLKAMRRAQRWATIMRVLYWIIIIGAAYGAYQFLTPYMDKAVNVINQSQDSINSLKNLGSGLKIK